MSALRLLIVVLLVGTTAALAGAARDTVPNAAGVSVPYAVAAWQGVDLDLDSEGAVGADFTLNRTYANTGEGSEAGLYIAYYAAQRPGVSIHSPLHCLPGTGWDVVSTSTIGVDLPSGDNRAIRRLVAQKGSSRVLVLYWYSINGEMISSELASRLQLFSNRIRLGRNDAALVRVAVPVLDSDAAAERNAVAFVRALVPHL